VDSCAPKLNVLFKAGDFGPHGTGTPVDLAPFETVASSHDSLFANVLQIPTVSDIIGSHNISYS